MFQEKKDLKGDAIGKKISEMKIELGRTKKQDEILQEKYQENKGYYINQKEVKQEIKRAQEK